MKSAIILSAIILSAIPANGQSDNDSKNTHNMQTISMNEAVAIAMTHHPAALNNTTAHLQTFEPDPLQISYWQLNRNDRIWLATQNLGSLSTHLRQMQHHRAANSMHLAEREIALRRLEWQTKTAYMDAVYRRQYLETMRAHNNYFEALIAVAEIYLAGDSVSDLVRISAGARYAAYQSNMYIAEEELKRAELNLHRTINLTGRKIQTEQTELELYEIHPDKNPEERFSSAKHSAMYHAQLAETESAAKLEKSRLRPTISAGYSYGSIAGNSNRHGFMLGIALPLWMRPQLQRIRQAEIAAGNKLRENEYLQFSNMQHIESLKSLLNQYFVQISFSKQNLLIEASLILQQAEHDFATGQITGYTETLAKITDAVSTKLNHLEYIHLYNRTALELEFYTQ